MLASRISSKAAFTRQRTGQAHSRRNAAAPRHPTRPLSTGPAPPRPGTATVPWRPCKAPHSRVSTLPIAHNRHGEDTTRRDITYMRSDTRRRTQQQRFAHCGHRTHRPDQPRGLRGLPPDKPSRTAHTTSTQPKRAQAARTRPSPCAIEHRRDGLQGRRCAR